MKNFISSIEEAIIFRKEMNVAMMIGKIQIVYSYIPVSYDVDEDEIIIRFNNEDEYIGFGLQDVEYDDRDGKFIIINSNGIIEIDFQ